MLNSTTISMVVIYTIDNYSVRQASAVRRTRRMRNPKHQKYMEDYLITLDVFFADTETGEVLAKSKFSKPLSVLGSDVSNYCKYFDSFFRGVRTGHKIALSILISLDRDLPGVKQLNCF